MRVGQKNELVLSNIEDYVDTLSTYESCMNVLHMYGWFLREDQNCRQVFSIAPDYADFGALQYTIL